MPTDKPIFCIVDSPGRSMVVRTVIDDIQRIVSVITAQIVCQKGKTKKESVPVTECQFFLIVVKDVVFPITKERQRG